MKTIKLYWYRIALLFILMLTGYLSFFNAWKENHINTYYSATVKSMLSSWHNFFFASFDPGGFVTVDKPALGFWLQALSAKLFGFHNWSLILPEALSTVISVAILYHLVQRTFGKVAGLLSALVLSLTPILIAVSRVNNLDASLVMVLLFATWALILAAEKGNLKFLLLSMALVGLGFNVKMLQSYMVLPAFFLVYLFSSSLKTVKKLIHITFATALLLIVSLSWGAIVDLTPADQRPYVGSSKTNSMIELALGYNGIQRITGLRNGERMRTPNTVSTGNYDKRPTTVSNNIPQYGSRQPDVQSKPAERSSQGDYAAGGNTNPVVQPPPNSERPSARTNPSSYSAVTGANSVQPRVSRIQDIPGVVGGEGENGKKGVFRIFNQQIAAQISWLLPLALLSIFTLSLCLHTYETGIRTPVVQHLLLWSGWITPMLVYFSIAGFFHRYYLSMLSPGIAALSGIGIVIMWKMFQENGWKWLVLPAAFLITASLQVYMLISYVEWNRILIPLISGISLISVLVLVITKLLKKEIVTNTITVTVAAGFAALLIAPAVWAYTPVLYGSQGAIPAAGPELNRQNNNRESTLRTSENRAVIKRSNMNPGGIQNENVIPQPQDSPASSKLINFLLSNKQGAKFIVAVVNAKIAAPIILQTGEPVMAVGGFSGADKILTPDSLDKKVKNGEIRYFLITGVNEGMGQQSDIGNWVRNHGTAVPAEKWLTPSEIQRNGNRTNGSVAFSGVAGAGTILYDLAPEKGTR